MSHLPYRGRMRLPGNWWPPQLASGFQLVAALALAQAAPHGRRSMLLSRLAMTAPTSASSPMSGCARRRSSMGGPSCGVREWMRFALGFLSSWMAASTTRAARAPTKGSVCTTTGAQLNRDGGRMYNVRPHKACPTIRHIGMSNDCANVGRRAPRALHRVACL